MASAEGWTIFAFRRVRDEPLPRLKSLLLFEGLKNSMESAFRRPVGKLLIRPVVGLAQLLVSPRLRSYGLVRRARARPAWPFSYFNTAAIPEFARRCMSPCGSGHRRRLEPDHRGGVQALVHVERRRYNAGDRERGSTARMPRHSAT